MAESSASAGFSGRGGTTITLVGEAAEKIATAGSVWLGVIICGSLVALRARPARLRRPRETKCAGHVCGARARKNRRTLFIRGGCTAWRPGLHAASPCCPWLWHHALGRRRRGHRAAQTGLQGAQVQSPQQGSAHGLHAVRGRAHAVLGGPWCRRLDVQAWRQAALGRACGRVRPFV